MTKDRLLSYLALLTTTAIWGIAGPVIKATLNVGLPPFTFLALRFLIAAAVISPFLIYYLRTHPEKWQHLPRLFFLSLLGTTATLALIFLGMERTTVLDATLITATAPIFIMVGGALFLRERVQPLEKIGTLVILAGVGITIIQPLLERGILAEENLVGNLLVFASNLTWAVYTLLSKKDYREHDPFLITSLSFVFGLLTFLPLAWLENPQLLTIGSGLSTGALGGVLYMALFSSLAAYLLYGWGLSKIEASEAAPFFYLEPLFAVPLAYWWLGETVTFAFLIGAAVIAAGLLLIEYRPPQFRHR